MALFGDIDRKVAEIETKQGAHTYAKAKVKIDRLLELQAERLLAIRTQEELEALSATLTLQATTISGEIRMKLQALLNKLQAPMNALYKSIQGGVAAQLYLKLPAKMTPISSDSI